MTATPAPTTAPTGVRLIGATELHDTALTPAALEFLAELHRTFDVRRRELLQARDDRYAELAAGGMLDFLPETVDVRDGDWQVSAHLERGWRSGNAACPARAIRRQ